MMEKSIGKIECQFKENSIALRISRLRHKGQRLDHFRETAEGAKQCRTGRARLEGKERHFSRLFRPYFDYNGGGCSGGTGDTPEYGGQSRFSIKTEDTSAVSPQSGKGGIV
jgi:hypothetical protein